MSRHFLTGPPPSSSERFPAPLKSCSVGPGIDRPSLMSPCVSVVVRHAHLQAPRGPPCLPAAGPPERGLLDAPPPPTSLCPTAGPAEQWGGGVDQVRPARLLLSRGWGAALSPGSRLFAVSGHGHPVVNSGCPCWCRRHRRVVSGDLPSFPKGKGP